MPRIILSGGGSAGHVNPALAISEIIREHCPDAEFLYVGTPGGMEHRLAENAGFNFASVKVAGFQRHLSLKNIGRNIKAAAYLTTAGRRSKKILKDFKPDLVIGTGGYVCGPIVREAAKMNIKTLIHEQNAFPGLTTKLLAPDVERIMLTVGKAADRLEEQYRSKCVVTGLPVRSGFLEHKISKEDAKKKLGLDDSVCILSTGGSLGARAINNAALELMEWYIRDGIKVNHIHSYGKNNREEFTEGLKTRGIDLSEHPNFIVKEYIDDMPTCMAAADLIISRCGMGALTEIEAEGRASILIPSPYLAENHQYYNGLVLQSAGAAVLYEQKDITDGLIAKTVSDLMKDPHALNEMSEHAAEQFIPDTPDRIWREVEALLKNDTLKFRPLFSDF